MTVLLFTLYVYYVKYYLAILVLFPSTGWLTAGPGLTSSNFSREVYTTFFGSSPEAYLLKHSEEIETLRPKTPPPKGGRGGGVGVRGGRGGRGGRGRGRGSGF